MPLTLNSTAPRIPGRAGALSPMADAKVVPISRHITLPAAPDSVQRQQFAQIAWEMLGNDRYGNCTFAGYLHLVMAIAALLGITITVPDAAAVVKAYLSFTHGVDSGAVEQSVLDLGYRNGICGFKLLGYATGDKGLEQMLQVTNTFGAAYLGVTLTAQDQRNFAEGRPWSLGSDRSIIGGHCVPNIEYDKPTGMAKIVTWGAEQLVEFEWLEVRMAEFHAAIPSQVATAGSLEGVAKAALVRDLDALYEPVAA